MKRILTAFVAIPILLFTVWSPIPFFFVGLATIVSVLALREFYAIAAKAGASPAPAVGYPALIGLFVCFTLARPEFTIAMIAVLIIAALSLELSNAGGFEHSLASVAATVFGVVYIGLLLGFLVGVRMAPDTSSTSHLPAKLLTTFFAVVMLTDTGAYCAGRALGRHKLAPRVSPGKTIEGTIGGLIAGILAGPLCKAIFFGELPLLDALLLGATVSLFGQAGDLVESMLKRGSHVKDSSNLLPGHGGMLDRIDSLLFAAPLIYYYSRFFVARY